MYQLNRLIPESINFVHTDTMYKLESFYHPGEKKESFGTKIPTESSCNELNERDKSLLKEIRQLDNIIILKVIPIITTLKMVQIMTVLLLNFINFRIIFQI
uniref:SJCHGC02800 protein n=1 Tax=Schistosoma japonicum TaxID=6182 RepID=Q5DG40_SCHJA|nr:SJCHGC02800 protein [Schistosoma japonicum]